jgi:predicted nucleotidyltransferase
VPVKTRPKTEYSIGDGIVQYVSVLPGQYTERRLRLTPSKEAMIRIWNLPQESFHTHVEQFWWRLTNSGKIDYHDEVAAVAVYGSVARGDADEESDIDFLVVTADADTARVITEAFGSVRIDVADAGAKIGMVETYPLGDYRESIARDSDFLSGIRDELHAIYDPDGVL